MEITVCGGSREWIFFLWSSWRSHYFDRRSPLARLIAQNNGARCQRIQDSPLFRFESKEAWLLIHLDTISQCLRVFIWMKLCLGGVVRRHADTKNHRHPSFLCPTHRHKQENECVLVAVSALLIRHQQWLDDTILHFPFPTRCVIQSLLTRVNSVDSIKIESQIFQEKPIFHGQLSLLFLIEI